MGVDQSEKPVFGIVSKTYFPILSWLTMFIGFVLVVFHRFAISGLQSYFSETLFLNSASFAILSSSYFYLYPLLQIPTGIALDLWGHRKIAILSFLTMTIGTVIFGTASTFGQLLLGRIIISFGAAFVWGTLLKIQGLFFSGQVFAFLTGLGAIAGSLGVILAGSPFITGIAYLGWRGMMHCLAGLSFLLLLASLLFTINPAYLSNKSQTTSLQKKDKTGLIEILTALRHKASWLLFLCHFGVYGSYAAFIGIWGYPIFIGHADYTFSQASFLITFLGFSYMLGGPILGHLSDRIFTKRRPILLLSCGCLAVFNSAFLLLPYFKGSTDILLYMAIFGIGFFTPSLILTMVLSKELQDFKHSGLAVGIANSGGFAGAAFSQLAVGFIFSQGWEGCFSNGTMIYPWSVFQQVILFSVFILVLAFFSAYFVEEK